MKEMKQAMLWVVVAFLVGGSMNLGHKIVSALWPGEESKVTVTHIYPDN